MLYVAVPAMHAEVGFVRVALPLTDVAGQLRRVGAGAMLAFASRRAGRGRAGVADVAAREPPGRRHRRRRSTVWRERCDRTHARLRHRRARSGRARTRCVRTAARASGCRSCRAIGHAWRRSCQGWWRASSSSIGRDACSWSIALRRTCCAWTRQRTGRPYVEVIRHPDIAAQLAATLRGGASRARELALSRDPGRTFVARAAPVSATGGGGAVLVLHDITDLRRADQIRRDFVANVSHELRTPLTAIRGYVEALLDEQCDEAETRRFLEIIGRHSTRMERLVKDLLRLARLDARTGDARSCAVRRPAAVSRRGGGPGAGDRSQAPARVNRGAPGRKRRLGRSRQAARHRPQSGGERGELLTRRCRSAAGSCAGRTASSRSPCRTPGREFRQRICRASSSGFIESTNRAPARVEPASAWPSSGISSNCMAVKRRPRTSLAAARCSRLPCQRRPSDAVRFFPSFEPGGRLAPLRSGLRERLPSGQYSQIEAPSLDCPGGPF